MWKGQKRGGWWPVSGIGGLSVGNVSPSIRVITYVSYSHREDKMIFLNVFGRLFLGYTILLE
jgi:hypothetical protein